MLHIPKYEVVIYNWETKKPERIEIFNGDMGFVYPHGFMQKNSLYEQT